MAKKGRAADSKVNIQPGPVPRRLDASKST